MVVIGIDQTDDGDAGEPCGVSLKGEIADSIGEHLDKTIDPPISSLRILPIPSTEDPHHGVLVVGVPHSANLHMTMQRFYHRLGSRADPMCEREVREAYRRLIS